MTGWKSRQGLGSVVWYSPDHPGVVVYFATGDRCKGYEVLSPVLPDIIVPTLDSAQMVAELISVAVMERNENPEWDLSVTETRPALVHLPLTWGYGDPQCGADAPYEVIRGQEQIEDVTCPTCARVILNETFKILRGGHTT